MSVLAGIPCKAYHAGLKASDRSQVLADWTSGVLPVVAATIAFGMGIDKAGSQPAEMPFTPVLHLLKTGLEVPRLLELFSKLK